MRATMTRYHLAARFSHRPRQVGEVVTDKEDEDGTLVSNVELTHHLNVGNAEPIKAAVERAVAPAAAEKAVPAPGTDAAIPRGRRRPPAKPRRGRRARG